ncbi:hypothetical protein [Streptomyces sp. ODS28]|uniref:hypothetical protein n=1 Tax=Streptomyces sp. ODS28 TaxID=3136688 RepID=UPI0031ED6D61
MRTSGRIAAAAVAVASAGIVLTGCGGGSEGGGDKAEPKPGQESPGGKPGELDGIWATDVKAAVKGGKGLVMTLSKGKAVLSEKTLCTGALSEGGTEATVSFKCPDGNTDFAKGTLKPGAAKQMTVTWANGKSAKLQQVADAEKAGKQLPKLEKIKPGEKQASQ